MVLQWQKATCIRHGLAANTDFTQEQKSVLDSQWQSGQLRGTEDSSSQIPDLDPDPVGRIHTQGEGGGESCTIKYNNTSYNNNIIVSEISSANASSCSCGCGTAIHACMNAVAFLYDNFYNYLIARESILDVRYIICY